MNKKIILDEIMETRNNNVYRLEQDKKLRYGITIIEKRLSDNLEVVINFLRGTLVDRASYGSSRCIYDIDACMFKLSFENMDWLSFEKINDTILKQKLFNMYSIQSRNGEFFRLLLGYVVRKKALFDRIQEEGLCVESTELNDSIRLVIYEPLDDEKSLKKIK